MDEPAVWFYLGFCRRPLNLKASDTTTSDNPGPGGGPYDQHPLGGDECPIIAVYLTLKGRDPRHLEGG